MDIDLKQGLGDIAADAPTPDLSADALWRTGRRRLRRRRAAAATASLAVVALVAGAVGLAATPGLLRTDEPPPAGAVEEAHLPDRVWQASGWTAGTERAGDPGRIGVVWWDNGSRRSFGSLGGGSGGGLMSVSAVDGKYRYLDLPDFVYDSYNPPVLSPDGRYLAYAERSAGPDDPAAVTTGWTVYDAQTGRLLHHEPTDAPQGAGGGDNLAWSPDSRTLLVDVCRVTQVDRSSQSCTTTTTDLWDVADDRVRTVAGPLASYVVGAEGDDLVVLGGAAGRALLRFDVRAGTSEPLGRLATYRGSQDRRVAVDPANDRATVAYTFRRDENGPLQLRLAEQRLGDQPGNPRSRRLLSDAPLIEPVDVRDDGQALTVVASNNGSTWLVRTQPRVGEEVDVVALESYGGSGPLFATDLAWEPTVPGVRPPEIRDPWAVGGGVALGLAAVAGLGVLWVRRRRGVTR